MSIDISDLIAKPDRHDDLFFYLINDRKYFGTYKHLAQHLTNKTKLNDYMHKYVNDCNWIVLLTSFYPDVNVRKGNDHILVKCCKYGHLEAIKCFVNKFSSSCVKLCMIKVACENKHIDVFNYLLSVYPKLITSCILAHLIQVCLSTKDINILKCLVHHHPSSCRLWCVQICM